MSLCSAEAEPSASLAVATAEAVALRSHAVSQGAPARVLRIGLLGLGQVGQAVARLASSSAGAHAGLRFRVDAALVRDVARPRRCVRPPRLTSNPEAFLRGRYDVVVEALGGLEPARGIVARLLGRGIPVVTANKTLIADAGQELQSLARARRTALRYEASAIAGVPFLGTLAARPLVAHVDRFTAILNGTSNFILSTLEREGGSFAAALAAADARGLTEPDPSRDLDGEDAADKLALLTSLLGWGRVSRAALDVRGIREVSSTDLHVARQIGGALKPVAVAARTADGIEACIGPAWVSAHKPLGALSGTLNGIELHGRHISDLFFSGPGAGPDITAATLLDDAVEAAHATLERPHVAAPAHVATTRSPATSWFVRVAFPGIVPPSDVVTQFFTRVGHSVEHVTDVCDGHARYVLLGPATRGHVDDTVAIAARQHRLACVAFRRIE